MARGEGSLSDKLLLKKALKKRISYMLRKPRLEPQEAYNLLKDFFRAYTGNKYEFTREELLHELDKIYLEAPLKDDLENVIKNLGRVEFAPVDFTQEEISGMLRKFEGIMDHAIQAESLRRGFWDNVASAFTKLTVKKKKGKDRHKHGKKSEPGVLEAFVEEANREESESEKGRDNQKTAALARSWTENSRKEPPYNLQENTLYPEATEYGQVSAYPEEEYFEEDIQEVAASTTSNIPLEEEKIQYSLPKASPGDSGQESGTAGFFIQETSAVDDSLERFEDIYQEFYNSLIEGNVDVARIEYEELAHAYENMGKRAKVSTYGKLQKAHSDLVRALS